MIDGNNPFVSHALSLCDESTTLPELVDALADHELMLSQGNLECVARQALVVLAAKAEAEGAARLAALSEPEPEDEPINGQTS
jgi:hypothetical protein